MVKKTDEEPSHLMRTIANLGNLKELGFWDRSGRSWEIDQRPGKIREMEFSWKIALVDLHYLDKVGVYCLGGIADHGFHKTSKLSHSLRLPFACISCLWVLLDKLVSLCILVESSLCVCVWHLCLSSLAVLPCTCVTWCMLYCYVPLHIAQHQVISNNTVEVARESYVQRPSLSVVACNSAPFQACVA